MERKEYLVEWKVPAVAVRVDTHRVATTEGGKQ
jgi:hypothetical protein